MFAEFGVDFLKYDFCNKPHCADGPNLYHRMGLALQASGREILFSACNWGSDRVEEWIRSTGAHMYRSTGDITDNFRSMGDIARSQFEKLAFSGPGCYNDLDMLVCGMRNKGNVAAGGMDDREYLFHFALWCVMQSPLMIGCDLRDMDEATLRILRNKALIAINQDVEARPIYQIAGGGQASALVGFKHLANNEFLLCCFNFMDQDYTCNVEFFDFGLPVGSGLGLRLRDVMTGEDIGVQSDYMRIPLESRDFKLYQGTLEAL
jgi:alpha-galactosidase